MIERNSYQDRILKALKRSPVVALVGARQVGKTTLAARIAGTRPSTGFDLESTQDLARLQNPELALESAEGMVVIDEIQRMPELFGILRVLVDRDRVPGRFLILGSASPRLIEQTADSLAGRVEFIDIAGFDLQEVGGPSLRPLWLRGGFPRSYLAETEDDSVAWREGFVRTFLERDIPQSGISIPAPAIRRFWTMLAHFHGQTWNASELARSMALDVKTVQRFLDVLTATFMVRQLQPWFVNLGKRQVKAPKVYLRDSGILHHLLSLADYESLQSHPCVGASWEGMIVEQAITILQLTDPYYWSTYQGAELDLLFQHAGRFFGIEVKFTESPKVTKSMRTVMDDLGLEHLWVVHPGKHRSRVAERITFWPADSLVELKGELQHR